MSPDPPTSRKIRALWRGCAYALFPLFLLEVLTGFGWFGGTADTIRAATAGLLDRGRSADLHIALMVPIALLFLVHSLLGLRFRLRWQRRAVSWSLALLGALAFAGVLFLVVHSIG